MIHIGGLVPFTTIDFPGCLSAVIFCQGCPWRCGYCHNTHLQPFAQKGNLSWEQVFSFLKKRQGILDAVVFSGGEPSLHPGLPQAIQSVKDLGYRIGLHTAGISPARLEKVLSLVDWIGMDIKAPFAKYEQVTRVKGSGLNARLSAQLVIQSGVDYEFRTTVHPQLLSEKDIQDLSIDLQSMGAKTYILQVFRSDGCVEKELIQSASNSAFSSELEFMLKRNFDSFFIRR